MFKINKKQIYDNVLEVIKLNINNLRKYFLFVGFCIWVYELYEQKES